MAGVRNGTKSDGPTNNALDDAPQLFGFGIGRLYALVDHQVCGKRTEHCAAVRCITAKLPSGLPVSHGSKLLQTRVLNPEPVVASSARAFEANCLTSFPMRGPLSQGSL